jgi:hypothetical protein
MSLKALAPMFMALFVIANTGAAFASPQPQVRPTPPRRAIWARF